MIGWIGAPSGWKVDSFYFAAAKDAVVTLICRRFMTAPGVGPASALSFKVTIDDPTRFIRSRSIGAHLGLTPRKYQSGTSVDWGGKISKMGDVDTRGALCEAAASLLLRVQSYSAFRRGACGSPSALA